MNAVILYRTDRARNMHRFYGLDVQPALEKQRPVKERRGYVRDLFGCGA